MAEIHPFRGVRYNQNIINDLTAVICPPYDIISPQLQDELYQSSEYNFVRIEYNRELPQDNGEDNRYLRSAANMELWIQEGILQADADPAFYFHQHYFSCQGHQYKRNNILAGVKLEEWDKKIILPHENIIPRAKSDRLNMLWACQADTSPVLAMYEDPRQIISFALTAQMVHPPLINAVDYFGERHKVWAITQTEVIRQIQNVIADQPLYIADGHHRYDSALTYRRERAAQSGAFTGEEGYNMVMTSLVDFADPGLIILPPHRLLRGISRPLLRNLKSQLTSFFDIEELPISCPDIWQQVDAKLSGMKPDMSRVSLAIFGLENDRLLILTLREVKAVNQMMPTFHGDLYKKLDVSLVDHVILEKLLAFDKDNEEKSLTYSYDRMDAVKRVMDQEYQLVFLLNPVKPELIRAIADAGDRMPRKSTYFYPKSPAGLVFYKW
jgi:uncharacterized protein (DUF1015 family)